MNSQLLFENEHLLWPVAIISSLLWLWFVWKEWQRPIQSIFYVHCTVALLGVAAMAMLALKPMHEQAKQNREAILLTENFSKIQLDSLQATKGDLKTLRYNPNTSVTEMLDSLGTIYVLGNGISPVDFWQFKNQPIQYLRGEALSGITQLKYSTANTMGDDFILQGRFQNPIKNHSLVLQDPEGVGFDSVKLTLGIIHDFKLQTNLKAQGKFVYQLVEKDSLGNQIKTNPLPILVNAPLKMKVLFLNKFPTFESKYLKNHLAEMGHEVVAQSQLTKGRYKYEYFNTDRTPINTLSQATLAPFDVLVLDAESYTQASLTKRRAIEKALKEDGLGVFIQPDANFLSKQHSAAGLQFKRNTTSKAQWKDFVSLSFEKYPYLIDNAWGVEKIHAGDNTIYTAYKRNQKGRIATTVIQNTFQQKLNGNAKAYQQFWNSILNTIAKKKESKSTWNFTTRFPVVNAPLEFTVQTNGEVPQVQNHQGQQIALKQHIDLPSMWSGVTYPLQSKWNQLNNTIDENRVVAYYVYESSDWKILRAKELQMANARQFQNRIATGVESKILKPIPSFWFFGIVLLAFGYLWLHPKLL